MQHGVSVHIFLSHFCTCAQKHRVNGKLRLNRNNQQEGSLSHCIQCVHVRSVGEQQFYDVGLTVAHCFMERGCAAYVLCLKHILYAD